MIPYCKSMTFNSTLDIYMNEYKHYYLNLFKITKDLAKYLCFCKNTIKYTIYKIYHFTKD